jgi:hypothetical protein
LQDTQKQLNAKAKETEDQERDLEALYKEMDDLRNEHELAK